MLKIKTYKKLSKHLWPDGCFWNPQTHFSKSKMNYVINPVSWTQTFQQMLRSSCWPGHSFYRWKRIPANLCTHNRLLSRMTDGSVLSWHGDTGLCNHTLSHSPKRAKWNLTQQTRVGLKTPSGNFNIDKKSSQTYRTKPSQNYSLSSKDRLTSDI